MQCSRGLSEANRGQLREWSDLKIEKSPSEPIQLACQLLQCLRHDRADRLGSTAQGSVRLYYEKQLIDSCEWPQRREHPVDAMIDTLRPYYAWADKTADLYADAYRSAFVTSFFLAAISVAMALGAVGLHLKPHSTGELIFAALELTMIGTILFLVIRGRRAHWHRRWLDYRLLAEMIRHQRLVAHLGGQRAAPQVPEHLTSYGNPGASWMAWYARALERSLGLPTAVVDVDYLKRSLDDQRGILKEQDNFHEKSQHRADRTL